MASDSVVEYTRPPRFFPIYVRVLTRWARRPSPGFRLPELEAVWAPARVDPARLAAYRSVCGLPEGGSLPLLYPHVLVSAMHLDLISHPDCRLPLLGALHQRNHVLQHRPIAPEEKLEVHCRLSGSRPVRYGLEFDVTTLITAGPVRVWESVSTYLSRGAFGEPGPRSLLASLPELDEPNFEMRWTTPPNVGRQYARVCGDCNPIHISSLLARLFGFRRAIVHGMWSAARCLAALPELAGHPLRCDLVFKGPVFVGSTVTLKARCGESSRRFDLYAEGNPRPCLCGCVSTAHAGATLVAAEPLGEACAPVARLA